MKHTPKAPKRVRVAKPQSLSQSQESSTRNLPVDSTKPVLTEIEIQVIETEFLSEQEASDVFTKLSNDLSSSLSELDNEWERIVNKEERTFNLGDLCSFFENYSSMKSTVEELTSLVKIYSLPLNDRKTLMDELEDKVKERQALVDQSLQQLQKTTGELQLTHKHQVIENWEKLFCATEAYNTHGRRWKFLMQPLKKSIKNGSFNFNPEVVLERARSAQGEDIDAIMERVSKQSKRSQTALSGVTTSEEAGSSGSSTARLDEEGGENGLMPSTQVMYHDVSTWTHEPEYTRSLIIAMKRPDGFDKSVILNISIQDNCYTIEFPLLPDSEPIEPDYCMFSMPEPNGEWLQMETDIRNESLKRFRDKDDSVGTLSLNIAIHPESLENEIISMLHLPLQDLLVSEQKTQPEETSNIVVTSTELSLDDIIHGAEFTSAETATHSLNQHTNEIRQVLSNNWKNFNLKPLDTEAVNSPARILLSYCWLNVKTEFIKEATTSTNPMEEVLAEIGYISKLESDSLREEEIRKLQDIHTQEIDSLKLEVEREAAAVSEEQMEQLDYLKTSNSNFQNEILQLASQLKTQQEMYESKLEQLLENLNTARSTQAVSHTENKLPHLLDKSTSPLISTSNLLDVEPSQKRPLVVNYPNPNWEEMVRGNFLERLEIFSDYMIKKQTHLRDKIRTQVSRGIEMQLATQHRLAPINTYKSYYDVSDDISLPSLFMPTQCSKHLVYTPRARAYFHPFGTKSTRISQAPTIFKLPHSHIPSMRSIDLYALSENHSSRMGEWQTQEDKEYPEGVLISYKPETPAPPPSTSMSFRASTASSVS